MPPNAAPTPDTLPLGERIRQRRKSRGLTLDAVAARSGVSKPYLSLIENGRVDNPPSDDKLRRIEHALDFPPGELVAIAHLARTPRDVRTMLLSLARRVGDGSGEVHQEGLDAAHDSGLLRRLVDAAASARGESTDVGTVTVRAVPVINKVSCGYPRDFTDLDYPPQHADSHVSCPDVNDVDAFGFRVFGDSMEPIYRENDIVIVSPSTDPLHGDDCFVRFASGETTFKRVFFEENPDDPATPGVIRLQPRNERHPPRTVAAAEVEAVYPAVYRYERVNQRPNGRVLR